MIQEILAITYFLAPGGIANMAPVLGKKLFPSLAMPIDGGKLWKGKPLFGKNKTWRGLLLGIIVGVFIFFLQQYLYQFSFFKSISLIDYPKTTILLGFLLGLGALVGDLVKSFFKRRIGISSGKPWIPFDQIDDAVGSIIFAAPIYFVGWAMFIYGIIIYFILNIVVNWIAYFTGIRKEKW